MGRDETETSTSRVAVRGVSGCKGTEQSKVSAGPGMPVLGPRPAESHAERSEVWGRQEGEALVPPAAAISKSSAAAAVQESAEGDSPGEME